MIRYLSDSNIKGWSTYPVRVLDHSDRAVLGYAGLAVTGRCAWVGFDRREEAPAWTPNAGDGMTPDFVGLQFPQESWDGTDIFVGEGSKFRWPWIVVNQRIYDLLKKNKVTNYELRPLGRVELLAQESATIH